MIWNLLLIVRITHTMFIIYYVTYIWGSKIMFETAQSTILEGVLGQMYSVMSGYFHLYMKDASSLTVKLDSTRMEAI